MLVMTAKPDLKKLALILGAMVLAILGLILLLRGGSASPATPTAAVANNDERVKFLTELGWEVDASPTETMQVKIPSEPSEVFDRYNALQLTQGYDLSQYSGKTVMRYVYRVNNFPGATEPVYATVLVHKNQIIGGDVTDTTAKGKVQPLKPTATDQ